MEQATAEPQEKNCHPLSFTGNYLNELHYLRTFNCLQLSSLAGYLRSQMDETEDTAIKQDLQRRIQGISAEINKRYNKVNEKNT